MTVQDLINLLNKVENKSKPIIIITWLEDDHDESEMTETDIHDRDDALIINS